MSQLNKAVPVVAALGVVVGLLALNLLFAPERPSAPEAASGGAPARPESEPAAPAPPSAPGPARPGSDAPSPDAPSSEAADAKDAPPDAGAVPLPRPESASAPGDAGSPPAKRGAVTAAAIHDAMEAVRPDIEACMDDWWALDPKLEGRLVMDFTLTPEGLGQVLVLEHDDVPFGVQTCFASAIYEADWPAPDEGELQVTYPFVFTADDGDEAVDTGA